MRLRIILTFVFVLSLSALVLTACNSSKLPTNAVVASPSGSPLDPCGISGPNHQIQIATGGEALGLSVSPLTGHIFVAEGASGVGVFSAGGAALTSWNTNLSYAYSVAVGPDGNAYVADSNGLNNRVQVFTPAGQFIRGWNSPAPADIKFLPNGNLLVMGVNGPISEYTQTGRFVGLIGDMPVQAGGIGVGANGSIYIYNSLVDSVLKFDSGGRYQRAFGTFGFNCDQIALSYGLVVGPDEKVWITDAFNGTVDEFTADGTPVGKWGHFPFPHGIALGPNGAVYVTDDNSSTGTLYLFNP